LCDVASNRTAVGPPVPPRALRKTAYTQGGCWSLGANHRMPHLNIVLVSEKSKVDLAAIVCSVSSASAVSEGRCTIAAGLPRLAGL
jgi:hypothetical protein